MSWETMIAGMQAERARQLAEDEKNRQNQFNWLGALGGALTGYLTSPSQKVGTDATGQAALVDVPWTERLVSNPTLLSTIAGGATSPTGGFRDFAIGGLQGYNIGEGFQQKQLEQAKLAQQTRLSQYDTIAKLAPYFVPFQLKEKIESGKDKKGKPVYTEVARPYKKGDILPAGVMEIPEELKLLMPGVELVKFQQPKFNPMIPWVR